MRNDKYKIIDTGSLQMPLPVITIWNKKRRDIIINYRDVFDFENIYKAFNKSKSGKRDKESVAKFECDKLKNLIDIKDELMLMKYKPSRYHVFYIYEPKERKIMSNSFKDKIVQHAICDNVVSPILNPKLIYDNAANQKGKGTHFALNRVKKHLRRHYINHGTNGYILKCDIHKYFDSMQQDKVLENTYKHMPDYGTKKLWTMFIKSIPNPGVPMGNLSSQSNAITHLDLMDQIIKRNLRIKGYVRYVDDFVLIHEDKKYLQYCKKVIEKILKESSLKLNPKSDLAPIKNGIDFLGYHIYLTDSGKVILKIRRKSKTAVRRKLRYFKKNLNKKVKGKFLTIDNILQSYISWRGHAKFGNCYYLIKKMDNYFMELFGKEVENIKSKPLDEIRKNIERNDLKHG